MLHSQKMRELLNKAIALYGLKGVHPASEIMPFMGEDEFESLVEDADSNGFQNAVKVTDEGLLIDGRNRICASIVLEKDVHIEVFNPSDPIQYVLSENLERRHLSSQQKAMIAVEAEDLYALFAEQAKERQKEAGAKNLESFNNGDSLVTEKIQELEPESEPIKRQERETATKIAKAFGTNQNYVAKAKKVKEHAPELASDVKAGKLDLNDAAKEAKQRAKDLKGQMQEAPKPISIKPDINNFTARKVNGQVTIVPKSSSEPTDGQSSESLPADIENIAQQAANEAILAPIATETKQGIETVEINGYTLHIWHDGAAKPTFNTANESIDWAWSTWNPVTGCLHGCSYCLDPETLVLMANGTTKPIKALCIGDDIVGVEKGETYHSLKKAKVLNHWWTYKPAYEIKMSNGETLIASGDHRFLTNRGWKYVTGNMSGHEQRPYLTSSNKILGIGTIFATHGNFSEDYKLGYLSAMIYGDAHTGTHDYKNSINPRPNGKIHTFRLALKDKEGVERTFAFLQDIGIDTDWFKFNDGNGNLYDAIRTSKKESVEKIEAIKFLWRDHHPLKSIDFWKGFLAGFFDAEGSYSNNVLRLHNSNKEVLSKVQESSSVLFDWVWDAPQSGTNKPMYSLRLKGGLSSALKFFGLAAPAISRKFAVDGIRIKGQGGAFIVSIEPIGYRHLVDITTETETFIANGFVSHNCYAAKIAVNERMANVYPKGFDPVFHPYRLDAPKNSRHFSDQDIAKKAGDRRLDLDDAKISAKNVFVCSMADLFGRWVPDEWIMQVFDSVIKYNDWNYLFLTKYPQRLQEIGEKLGGSFPDNCWVGTTVDEQKRVRIAQNAFANIKASVKWLSLEPLLTNLEFTDLGMFDMVAIGGETNGQTVTFTPHWEWVENILWQARQSGTAVYFKENLLCRPKETPWGKRSLLSLCD